jgi:hypothetical protein
VFSMFETLQRLYNEKKLTKAGLVNAVAKSWITAEQYESITGEPL